MGYDHLVDTYQMTTALRPVRYVFSYLSVPHE